MINRVSIVHQLIIILLLSMNGNCYATDFGRVGQTFKVVEESFVVMLKKRLDKVDMEKEREKIQDKAKERVENPVPVRGITSATKDREFYFDPSYVLEKDAVLPCGKILHKAGTRVNPLSHMNFNRRLFFIDGRQKEQIAWLKKQLNNPVPKEKDKEPVEDRVILVGGSVFKLEEELDSDQQDKVYFDQAGELTSKFGIKAVPAVVGQEGRFVKIKEININ